jgi:hypothetical protein
VLGRLTAVIRCVSDQPLHAVGQRKAPQEPVSIAFLPLLKPAVLHTMPGRARIALAIKHDLLVMRVNMQRNEFEAITAAYAYRILDHNSNEIIAYHWHPNSASTVTHPHLHLSHQLRPIPMDPNNSPVALADMHVATGFVSLSDVVRMLIVEFGVEPRRAGWETILEDTAMGPMPSS